MHRILEDFTHKIPTLGGVTIGSAGIGTSAEAISHWSFTKILINTDLLSLLQYGAYVISMIVGILTILTWCKKNRSEKKIRKK